jgi:transposase
MSRKRRAFNATFKSRVAIDALKGLKTVGELAKQHSVHPTQVALWKKQLIDQASSLFEAGSARAEKSDEPGSAELYEQIGRLKIQLEWLKKKVAEHGG